MPKSSVIPRASGAGNAFSPFLPRHGASEWEGPAGRDGPGAETHGRDGQGAGAQEEIDGE